MTEQRIFAIANNALSIAGINIAAGAGTGSWLKVTPRGEWRTVVVGLQGDVIVNELGDRSADVELVLLQTATLNKQLGQLVNRTVVQDGDVGIGDLLYEELADSSGVKGTEISGPCVLTAPPEYASAGEGQELTWKGVITKMAFIPGGR